MVLNPAKMSENSAYPQDFKVEDAIPESDEGKVGRLEEDDQEELVLSGPLEIPLSLDTNPTELPLLVEPPGLFLREWGPLSSLLSKIPAKAQKGLTTLDLKLTCIAAVGDFIALGTNVGLVYWYNRKLDDLNRFKTEKPNSPISTISVVSSVDYMLAAGNKEGLITIFQIPKGPDFNVNNNRKTQIFTVSDLHSSFITALEWSSNGMKLFSGNATGSVVVTDIDYDLGMIKSKSLIEEKYEIVQLSYARKHLLVCSTLRSIVYSLETMSIYKVGTQDRKMHGKYGGIFQKSSYNENPKLLSVRPGGRIWVASSNGMVEHTIKFKDLLLENNHPFIPVINPKSVKNRCQDFQLGILYRFMHSYIATHHKDVLFVLDPVNTRILGLCQELKSVVDIAVSESEIFVLQSDRNVVRLSSVPDKQSTFNQSADFLKGVGMIPNIMSASISDFRLPQEPMNYLTAKLKETSRALPKINSSLLNTLKNVIEVDMDIQDGQIHVIPPIIPLKESDIPNIVLENLETPQVTEGISSVSLLPPPVVKDRFEHISCQPFEEVLLQPIKKRRKRKTQKPDTIFLSSGDTVSLSSTYSTNSEGDATAGVFRRLSSQSDSPQSSQSTSTSSEPSKINADLNKISPYMSRSWNIGQPVSNEVSLPDLETKEEILARKLNWPELLPLSARETVISSGNSKQEEERHHEPPSWGFGSRDTLDGTGDDGGSSILTLRDAHSSDIDTDDNNPPPTLSRSSLVSSSLVEEMSDQSDAEFKNRPAEEDSLSNAFEQSVDIYTKYAPQDESQSGSQTSGLSFGPPSGSSVAGINESRSLGNIAEHGNQIFEIDETSRDTPADPNTVSLMEIQDMMVDPIVIGNDSWLSYKSPASLQSISGCDAYVVCTDTKNNVYYSRLGEVSLRWIPTDYQASQLAISPCGSVVWRLFKGTLYSLMDPTSDCPLGSHDVQWSKLSTNVASIAVKRHVGWIVKTDGSVHICCGLLESAVVPDFEKVHCKYTISQISVLDNFTWAITLDGRVIYRVGITDKSCKGVEWVEKYWETPIPPASTICLGPANSVWIADAQDNLYFVSGVTGTCYGGMSYPWKVSFGDYTFCNGNGNFSNGAAAGSLGSWKSRLSDSFRADRISSLLTSRASPILFSTTSSMWYSTSGALTVQVSKTQAEGHGWTSMKLDRLVRGTTWSTIFAGSIYKEHGYLWLSDSKGKLFYCPPQGGELRPVDLPCSTELVCISPAPDALWILNSEGIVYGRCNISSINPIGHGWDKMDLSPLNSVHFVHVSCGSDVAWACDNKGNIYMRVGSLRPPGPNDMSPAWVQVEGSPMQIKNCIFTKVYVGTSGSIIWALDNCKNIYVREAVYPDYPIGTRWLLVSGIEAIRLAVSEVAVWALSPKGEIFRRYGISSTNFVGDYWKKVPGTAKVLTVSLCDEIWALDTFGQLTKHSQEILNFKERTKKEKPQVVLDPEDKDWEFVDSL